MLNTVDLPQPDGPIIETNSPERIENEKSWTATTSPSGVGKLLLRCRASSKSIGSDSIDPDVFGLARCSMRSIESDPIDSQPRAGTATGVAAGTIRTSTTATLPASTAAIAALNAAATSPRVDTGPQPS